MPKRYRHEPNGHGTYDIIDAKDRPWRPIASRLTVENAKRIVEALNLDAFDSELAGVA